MLKPNSILDLQKLCIGAASVYSAPLFFSEKRTVWMYIFSFIHGIKWCDFIEFFFFWSWPNQFQSFKIHAGFGRFQSACSRTCCDEFMYLFKPSSPDKLLKDSETLLNTYQRLQKLFCLIQVPVKPTEDHCLSWVLDDDFILACELHNRKYYSLLEFEKRKQ